MTEARLRRRGGHSHWAAILGVGLIAGAAAQATPLQGAHGKAGAGLVPRGLPFEDEAREGILHKVLTHPGVAHHSPAHRLAAIRLTVGKATDPSGETRSIATVVLFDHTVGEARRVLLDLDTGALLANRLLPGRPQGSREESEEAARIIRRDPGLAGLLDEGGVLDGGFVVADPGGSRRRMMQLKLLSADRRRLLRSVTVDLTEGVIAADPKAGLR